MSRLWDLTNTSTSSLPGPVSCTAPVALRAELQLWAPLAWILVLACNQELAPAALASNFLNSFLFFILVLGVRGGGKESHSFFTQVLINHLFCANHWGYSREWGRQGPCPHRNHILMDGQQIQGTYYHYKIDLHVWLHLVLMMAALLLSSFTETQVLTDFPKVMQLVSDGDSIEIQELRFRNSWIPNQYNIGKFVLLGR